MVNLIIKNKAGISAEIKDLYFYDKEDKKLNEDPIHAKSILLGMTKAIKAPTETAKYSVKVGYENIDFVQIKEINLESIENDIIELSGVMGKIKIDIK